MEGLEMLDNKLEEKIQGPEISILHYVMEKLHLLPSAQDHNVKYWDKGPNTGGIRLLYSIANERSP